MSTGSELLGGVLVLCMAFGAWRATHDGRVRASGPVPGPSSVRPAVAPHEVHGLLGERATLLQFSSAFCAPCRTARAVLSRVADELPGVAHVEVDAESRLDLVRRLGITRTPTTLVLDAAGREVGRAAGAPRAEDVRRGLVPVLASTQAP